MGRQLPSQEWQVKKTTGTVSERHLDVPNFNTRQILLHEIESPTLVLGTAQRNISISTSLDLVKRRSGGGAVFLRANEILWIDFVLPRNDNLWMDDISNSSLWLGDVWCSALLDLGFQAKVHRGQIVRNTLSETICFAGLAPGEVLIDGKKVLGISQRRNNKGAWFQCALLLAWPAEEMVKIFSLKPFEKVVSELKELASPVQVDTELLLEALFRHLP